jgi:DNA-dependent RNA polymerase auxiliary subunit epsilon
MWYDRFKVLLLLCSCTQVGVPETTAALFKDKEVDGQVLSLLTEEEFKTEFNISFGQRKKILMLRDDVVCKGKCMLGSYSHIP